MNIYVNICLLALLGLVACSDDKPLYEEGSLSIVAGATPISKTAGYNWNVWEVGDEVRISYKKDYEQLGNFPFSDRLYIYTADSQGVTSNLSTLGTPISQGFINDGAASMDVFAYSANRFDLFEQIQNNEYYDIDLSKTSALGVITNPIFAIATRNASDADTQPITLEFHHLLSQLTLTLVGYPGGTVPSDLKVYLTGTKTAVKHEWMPNSPVSIWTSVSDSKSSSDTIFFVSRVGSSATDIEGSAYPFDFEGEVAPQKITGTPLVLHMEDSGGTKYEYAFPDPFEFVQDFRYNLTLDFGDGLVDFWIEAEEFSQGPGFSHNGGSSESDLDSILVDGDYWLVIVSS